jgi:predicted nucleotide-binding protein
VTVTDVRDPENALLARQIRTAEYPNYMANVILELGYFPGKLGRRHIAVSNKGGVEQPSDVLGILYLSYPDSNWKMDLAKELQEAGFVVRV